MPQPAQSIDHLLEEMVSRGASDLHVSVNSAPAIRVRGHIERLDEYETFNAETTQQLLYRILSSEQQKQLEIKRQLDFAHAVPGVARFRVNVYFQREAVGAAFRVIPEEIKTLEELNLPHTLHQLASYPRGIVLVTGPTGSGKSTTLASIIDEINRTRAEHILTVEDPVEFVHKHNRIIDVFPPAQQEQVRIMIANSLQGVVTQTLLPTADGNGRVAALEILIPDDAVRNLIRQAKIEQVYSVMQTNTGRGMQTMEQALADLTMKRVVKLDDALTRSSRPEQLTGILERGGFDVASALAAAAQPEPLLMGAPNGGGLRTS